MAAGLTGFGLVKAILSGDTVVVVGAAKPGSPPPEMQLSLSCLAAPRMSRHPEQKDELWGFASREFLRKIVIGRTVKFRVDYRSANGRAFATLWLPAEGTTVDPGAASLNMVMAASGMVRALISNEAKEKVPAEEVDAIQKAQAAAVANGYGVHSSAGAAGAEAGAIRDIKWNLSPEDATALAAECGPNTPLGAVVEQVISGSTYRIYIPEKEVMATFQLAALQCPRAGPASGAAPATTTAAGQPSQAKPPSAASAAAAAAGTGKGAGAPAAAGAAAAGPIDPIGAEAKAFVERLLLNRDVNVYIGGADKYGNLIGRIEHPAGDIAVELLKTGLAKMVDWSASFTSASHVGTLRAAERQAKAAKLKLHAGYEAPKIVGVKNFEGRLIEVVSGDTLVILTNPGRAQGVPADERRISLSSIRAPRLGNAQRGQKDAPWAWEAKEWLRKNYAGKDVTVSVEYTRTIEAKNEAGVPVKAEEGAAKSMTFGTVTFTTKKGETLNLAVDLVQQGLAEVVRHRQDDDGRSAAYDDLLAAEDAVKAAKRGIHSAKEAPAHRFADLSVDAGKAKAHFPFLQRAKTLRAIPDYCFAGGRCKLFLLTENVYIIFGIAGVRCPSTAKAASKRPDGKMWQGRAAEPLGPEALAYMRENTLQQEVEIEAEDIDRNGCILGPMWIGKGGARKNVGADILRKGLGTTIEGVVEKGLREADELITAEGEARSTKRGVWQYITEADAEASKQHGADGDDEDYGIGLRPIGSGSVSNAAAGLGGMSLGGADAAAAGDGGADASMPALPAPGGAAAASSSSSSASAIPCVLADITDGSRFTIQAEADRLRIDEVNGVLEAMMVEHGAKHAGLGGELKPGRVVACLYDTGSGRKWCRAKVTGKHKAEPGVAQPKAAPGEEGLTRWDVLYMDYGNRGTATVMSMRPLEAPYSGYPGFARDATLAFLRVPGLDKEHGPDAAEALSELCWGRPLYAIPHGKDVTDNNRLQLQLIDAESNENIGEALVRAGLARIARSEARRVKRKLGITAISGSAAALTAWKAAAESNPGDKDTAYLYLLEKAQSEAKADREGMWQYGDVGDSDLEEGAGSKFGGGARAGGAGGWAAAVKK